MNYTIYTDGSFNVRNSRYGGAWYLVELNRSGMFSEEKEQYVSARNVSGECGALMHAVWNLTKEKVLVEGDELEIYYDYQGLRNWYVGEWKAKSPIAVAYKNFMEKANKELGVKFRFHKVKAHTGVKHNEYVDQLAKSAVGM